MHMTRRNFLIGGAAFVAANALPAGALAQGAGGKKTIAASADGTIRIAHCGDPQFGFGKAPEGKADLTADLISATGGNEISGSSPSEKGDRRKIFFAYF